jgi:hypothetical protein
MDLPLRLSENDHAGSVRYVIYGNLRESIVTTCIFWNYKDEKAPNG